VKQDGTAGPAHSPPMPHVTAVPADPALIASLPGCDFADAFSVVVARRGIDARELSATAFSRALPDWAHALMRIRNGIMGRLGYKAPPIGRGFPVFSETADAVVSGLNDGHLDFRALFRVEPEGADSSRITVTTAVRTHNALGRAYLAVIKPFHKLIVRSMVGRIARQIEAA
jgi:hypothetical protein